MNNLNTLGKIPPQDVSLEEAIIGGILLESEALIEIVDILRPESFYKDEHSKIYKAAIDLFKRSEGVDLFTIMNKLRSNNELESIGGPAYLTKLTTNVASAAHIEFHARIVQQKYIQRELIRVSSEIQNKAFDSSSDVSELLDFSESQLFNIANNSTSKEARQIGDISKDELIRLDIISKSKDAFSGVPTGLTEIDKVTNGLQPSNLIIIGGRPAMGKTSLVLQIAINCTIDFKIPVAFFSLEMGEDELSRKIIGSLTGLSSSKLRRADFNEDDWGKLDIAQSKLDNAPLYIDDNSGLTPIELRAKCRRLKMKHDIKLIIIDYIQLMGSSVRGNREQELSSISRSLKILAKELKIPVVALSQLNRAVEQKPDKKPDLSHIRESGAIEQDADIVAFVYRPWYYNFTAYEDQSSTYGIMEFLIRKYRAGSLADIKLRHNESFGRIYNETEVEDINPIQDNSDLETNLDF